MAGKTLYDKLWDDHLVKQRDDGASLIYIDRHLLHEVTSPQAFEGLLPVKKTNEEENPISCLNRDTNWACVGSNKYSADVTFSVSHQ